LSVITSTVSVGTPDGSMDLFVATPEQEPATAGVVLLQEAFGVNHHIQDVARRYATGGYLVAAPDLYHRFEQRLMSYDDIATAKALLGRTTQRGVLDDVRAAQEWLAGQVSSIGVVGYCFGGRVSWLAAANLEGLDAAVVYYGGGIVTEAPDAPVRQAAGIGCPLLAFFGAEDQQIPAADVNAIRDALDQAGARAEVRVLPGVGHGFACDARPDSHDAEAAAETWTLTERFLHEHLVGQPATT